MLTVPALKPGEQPLSPDLQQALTQTAGGAPAPTPEETAQIIFDHAVVKDSLTTLHQEIDKNLSLLATYDGTAIADIPADQNKHLSEQIHKHKNAMKNPRQQQLFDQMTRDLFAQARLRAQNLHLQKIRQYQTETMERQNAELAARALAEETLFDDRAQTRYRDIILFNLETLHQDLPERERREKLDAASRELYRKIIDSRLEQDPARLAAMLSAPAVRRALGEQEAKEYDEKVASALRDLSLRRTAREWVDADIPPDKAEKRAEQLDADKPAVLDHYRRFLADKNEKSALTHLLAVQSAWAAIKEGGYRHEAIPVWAARKTPGLYTFLRDLLDSWLGNGGAAPEPDYARFLSHMMDNNRQRMWETLSDEEGAYAFIRAMGGVENWAFDIASRKILAASTPGDKALVADLSFAQETFLRMEGDGLSGEGAENRFLALVRRDRHCKLARLDKTELLFSELFDLVRSCGR